MYFYCLFDFSYFLQSYVVSKPVKLNGSLDGLVLGEVRVFGVQTPPTAVWANGQKVHDFSYSPDTKVCNKCLCFIIDLWNVLILKSCHEVVNLCVLCVVCVLCVCVVCCVCVMCCVCVVCCVCVCVRACVRVCVVCVCCRFLQCQVWTYPWQPWSQYCGADEKSLLCICSLLMQLHILRFLSIYH